MERRQPPRDLGNAGNRGLLVAHHRASERTVPTPVLHIGDISTREGGHLAPHISHQSGRDVDLGYYYTTDEKWYTTANQTNLDLPRTWAFVRITISETDVQALFIDRKIQVILREYAQSIGEDEAWLDQIFGGESTKLRPLIMHEDGHETHIHVRYFNPVAQETGRRIYPALLKHKMLKPPTYYVQYKVKRGDTLIRIAKKFNTTVATLKKANRLRSSRIIANRVYKIPRRGGVVKITRPVQIPARRVPPPASVSAAPPPGIQAATEP